jgi:Leucine-rich repeat (LRR) protein
MNSLQISTAACYVRRRVKLPAGLLAFLVAALWFLVPLSVEAAIPQQERDALVALCNATDGANWYNKAGWLGAAGSECTWYGVTCDSAQSNVVQLSMQSNGLNGSIPSSLGNLTKLQVLNLGGNYLSGTIPSTLGNLTQLTSLSLYGGGYYDVRFTGGIPPELGLLTNLFALDLSGNQLSGSIPSSLGNLTKLQTMNLSYNQLSGSIPGVLGNLTLLTSLNLAGNQLSGSIPAELGALTKLTTLDLSGNQLSGNIPSALGSLTQLTSLGLYENQLSGSIPAELGNLTKLQNLDLYGNQLTGALPSSLGKLTQLTWLGLSGGLFGNQFNGSIPPELGSLTKLYTLDLSGNQLSGNIPSTLGNMTQLGSLYLSGNQLSGTIPSALGKLTQLGNLDLSGNQLSGSIPVELGDMKGLYQLRLNDNQLSGSIPSALSKLTQIGSLDLSENQLSGTIPVELGNMQLYVLRLGNNQLSGSIPSALAKLTRLGSLDLSENQLTGIIPPELGNMQLYELRLSGNQLSGSIPSTLGRIQYLGYLDLSGNQLSGSIPTELGNLQQLYALSLNANQLSGSIPAALGNLTYLELLDLGYNRLSGKIPPELGDLTSLSYLSLYGNQLSGPIPTELKNLQPLHLYIVYNALSAADDSLKSFLSRAPRWDTTQTVTPADVSGMPPADSSISLSWTPIAFKNLTGRYEVWSGTKSGGPYSLLQSTASKSSSSLTLTGLTPAKTYNLVVRTVTDPHGFNQNTVASNFSPEVSVAAGSKTSLDLTLNSGGSATATTFGSQGSTQAGYAMVNVSSGTAPYGTAVFSYKQNNAIVSEVGVPASPPTTSARIFIDYRTQVAIPGSAGKVDIYTGFAAVNRGSGLAAITYTLRSLDGQTITSGTRSLDKDAHIAKFITELPALLPGFTLPASFPTSTRFGTLELTSDQPLSVLALRMTTNQIGETLFTSTPIADLTKPLTSNPVYFPQLVDGGGYTTTVILMNTSAAVETGTLQLYTNEGAPFVVRTVDGTSDSSFTYDIQPRGTYIFQTDASPQDYNVGWVTLSPGGGTSTPVGAGVFQYSPAGTLVTESGIPSTTPTTHARVFIDTSSGHNTGLALGNPGNAPLNIALAAFQLDGSTQTGTSKGPVPLDSKGHAAKFVDQLINGLPVNFQGVLDIVSASPFAALTLRSLVNERDKFLLTTFPVADMNAAAPFPIVFPQIADGGGFTTQFILLSAGAPSATTTSLFGDAGTPLAVGK